MTRDSRRDPYRNFNFRVLFGAIGGVAALGIVGKLVAAARRRKRRRPPVVIEEVSSGARPIEAVGTSTAGFVGTAPRKARPSRGTGARRTPGRKGRTKT
jgi:hypothetical protein